jgi:hypothetical protein
MVGPLTRVHLGMWERPITSLGVPLAPPRPSHPTGIVKGCRQARLKMRLLSTPSRFPMGCLGSCHIPNVLGWARDVPSRYHLGPRTRSVPSRSRLGSRTPMCECSLCNHTAFMCALVLHSCPQYFFFFILGVNEPHVGGMGCSLSPE